MSQRKMGPNVKLLYIRFMSREAIPPGGDFDDGAKFLVDEGYRKEVMTRALANMDLAIKAVRSAPDNPYGDDEEAIAEAILQRLNEAAK